MGRCLIGFAAGLLQKALSRQHLVTTLLRFAGTGLAIGSAWGGLLANFAAGVFLFVLRPFKVGDFIPTGCSLIGLLASRARLRFTGTRRLTRTFHRTRRKGTFLLCLDTGGFSRLT